MNPLQTRRLTRQQIGAFVQSERGIRAFEDVQSDLLDQNEALTTASFLTLTNDPSLGAERSLTLDSNDLLGTDGGANSAFTLALKPTGVAADTYGDMTHFVSLTVDDKGRISAIQEHPVSGASVSTATLDFGAFPGSNEANVSFADSAILAGSNVQAWFAADSTTADHTADDHRYAPIFIHLTALPTAGVGGTIYARSEHKMQGQWAVKYSWS